jgi:hypothetical protein
MAEQTRKNVLVREIDTLGVDLWPVGSFWQICATYFASSIIRALLIMQAGVQIRFMHFTFFLFGNLHFGLSAL